MQVGLTMTKDIILDAIENLSQSKKEEIYVKLNKESLKIKEIKRKIEEFEKTKQKQEGYVYKYKPSKRRKEKSKITQNLTKFLK